MSIKKRQYLSIHEILTNWGKSRRVNDAHHLSYPHETPFSRLSRNSRAVGDGSLPEEDHQLVDSAVSELRARSDARHEVLVLAYVDGLPDGRIAKRLRQSRSKAREIRISAEAWVEAKIPESYWLQ